MSTVHNLSKSKSKSKSNDELKNDSQKKTIVRKRTIKKDTKKNLNVTRKNKTMNIDEYNYKDDINDFKQNGVDTLNKLTEKQLSIVLDESCKAYYNETPIMTDNEFDIIKEYMESKYPNNKILTRIGAPVQEKNKVRLPYDMPSMDKIKPDTDALPKWKTKYRGPYLLSAKLDGVSAMYSTEKNERKLYTRGNGTIGQDISHLIPFLRLPNTPDVTIRGELIMKKTTFINKYQNNFSNSRNLVAGLVNQKKINPDQFKDIDFVAYEVIKPSLNPSNQMNLLESLDISTVIHRLETDINNDKLSNILVDWRDKYEYTIDGIIVMDNNIYIRTGRNPEHGFAFKMVLSDQIAEAKVVNVIWSPSKDGYLKPRIQIEPVTLGGVKIEYATAFNAAFVEDNKLGVGAVVKLIRSGDVIPHIMSVIEQADKANMPNIPYKWNDTHIDIIMDDADQNETVREKNIVGFFKGLEVDGLGQGNVKKIIDAGYDTIPKIIAMTESDLLKIDGFKNKMAEKIYKSIHEKLNQASLAKLMAVSNLFGRGFGEKRIVPILEKYPDILISTDTNEEKINKIKTIKGMEQKTAEQFVTHINQFIHFMDESNLQHKLNVVLIEDTKHVDHILYGKTIVITGFRNKALTDELKNLGAKESSAVSKNTFAVIVKSKTDITGKIEAAQQKNVPIYTLDEFTQAFNILLPI